MVWSLCYLVFRCVLQLVLLRPRSEHFKELEIVVLRHGALGAASTDRSAAADGDRSSLLGCGESVLAAVELAIVLCHADNARGVHLLDLMRRWLRIRG